MNVGELIPQPLQWEPFRRDRMVFVPAKSGCYVLTTLNGRILYIGLAKNLRRRMEDHLDTPAKLVHTSDGRAVRFHWLETEQREALERGWLNMHQLATGAFPVLNKAASPVSC